MHAELVRVALHEVDIKIVSGERMHVLQWRRNLLWDEVLLDGKRQAASHDLWGREKVYGLVFGRDLEGKGGEQVMLILDPAQSYDFSHVGERIRGVRLEGKNGALVSYGSLEANALKKPATFSDWMKKSMGMDWGEETGRRPN
ncbi:hypothetical protein BBF93_00950 [Hyphomonas sp. CACIAM 19H1]|uniref:hypothetical protein n=1 Tax=Hyphomonas sp. CACIAM 19H1 TaxID=1873716 RepID=UPI000DEE162A|nr:hypothetical protein [Hyphomonas sp. CACIAM 19H1]AXE62930.1 hypothetical protein BBF93_00950 [Hyphomonas sp. CACIAM 19H1]